MGHIFPHRDAFVEYAGGIADARNMRLAMVLDDYSGGATTNRPVLNGILDPRKLNLPKAHVNAEDTKFNGYDVTNTSYYIPNNGRAPSLVAD